MLKALISSCFRPSTCIWLHKEANNALFDQHIYQASKKYNISILPITHHFDIENLYPLTDHVELWNVFIVGNDKTYILANANDPRIDFPNLDRLANHRGTQMPSELAKFFDSVWDTTLSNKQLQFYIVWRNQLYFVNTYPFKNGKGRVIGAAMFMRAFDTMRDAKIRVSDEEPKCTGLFQK